MQFLLWLFLLPLLLGLYFIGRFIAWFIAGDLVAAEIIAFQKKTYLGVPLPGVVFEDDKGKQHKLKLNAIDQCLYFFNRPMKGAFITVIYKTSVNGVQAKVFGYMSLILGLLLCVPFLLSLMIFYGGAFTVGPVLYALILFLMMFGCWLALKFMQTFD